MLMPNALVKVIDRNHLKQVIHVLHRKTLLQVDVGCLTGSDDGVDVWRDVDGRDQFGREGFLFEKRVLYPSAMVKKSKLTLNT